MQRKAAETQLVLEVRAHAHTYPSAQLLSAAACLTNDAMRFLKHVHHQAGISYSFPQGGEPSVYRGRIVQAAGGRAQDASEHEVRATCVASPSAGVSWALTQ